jgi:hypothetical protein
MNTSRTRLVRVSRGLLRRSTANYYVLFFIQLESRRVDIAGITVHPNER